MAFENKLKVAMICHFSNPTVRAHLPLDDRRLYASMRKILRLPSKNMGYGDIAPWDSNIIEGFKSRNDVELYVISAHSGLKRNVVVFTEENVNYRFVRCDFATMLKHLIPSPKIWLWFNPMRKLVKRLVNEIQPDIVLLFGAENAYISSTILDLGDYPRMIMCQTIYNNPQRKKFSVVDKKNAYVERKIFEDNNYFSTISDMHRDLLRKMKPDAAIFHWEATTPLPDVNSDVEKEYDFVNFALEMSKKKGFHDSIKALSIVKREYPRVKLNLTGGCASNVREELEKIIDELGVGENVVFTPFFEKQDDLFQHIQKSRYAVLPCKMDYVAGTMTQCMHYGIPIVVYETSGTPTLNSEGECVLIAENSDFKDLAEKMVYLLRHPEEAKKMAVRARLYSEQFTNRKKIVDEILKACYAVIEKEKEGKEIPEEVFINQ